MTLSDVLSTASLDAIQATGRLHLADSGEGRVAFEFFARAQGHAVGEKGGEVPKPCPGPHEVFIASYQPF
jgi:hypothetical protein